jgi:hypothetical protein
VGFLRQQALAASLTRQAAKAALNKVEKNSNFLV